MFRIRTLKKISAILLVLILGSSCAHKSVDNRPNVIVILADDLGYNDVGFNGSTDILTPNIDRIAQGGVTFTNGYVSYAVCGPSRAGLITGRYQERFGFGRNPLFAPKDSLQGLPLSEQTMAEYLAPLGYQNMAIGKWHLGAHERLRPLERGFHEFYGFLSGGHRYFQEEWTLNDISEVKEQYEAYQTKILRDNQRIDETEYLTDALSREAVNFVKRNKDKPFFLYLAYNAPHGPLQATEKYLNRYKHIEDKKRRTYAAMVSAMDDGVGLLLDQLEQMGLSENTLIFFLSDNGGPEKVGANNGTLRDGKGSLFEGGVRVPFAVQWKGRIPAGVKYNNPVISLDIFGTMAGLLGKETKNPLDGVNLEPFLTGSTDEKPHETLYWRKFDNGEFAIRSGSDKIVFQKNTANLFDLDVDISEETVQLNQEKTKLLLAKYNSWQQQMTDPIFLGLMQDEKYSRLNPDRFENVTPY